MTSGARAVAPRPKPALAAGGEWRNVSAVERAGLGSLHEGQRISYTSQLSRGPQGKTWAWAVVDEIKSAGTVPPAGQ